MHLYKVGNQVFQTIRINSPEKLGILLLQRKNSCQRCDSTLILPGTERSMNLEIITSELDYIQGYFPKPNSRLSVKKDLK